MPKVEIPITAGFYESDSLPVSAQRCVNLYPNRVETEALSPENLFNTPGLVEATRLLSGVCRGGIAFLGLPYFVIGQRFVRVDMALSELNEEVFSVVDIGVVEGNSAVSMAQNGDQICIVAEPDFETAGVSYVYDINELTFTEITDVNFLGPMAGVVYSGGLFVFSAKSGFRFFNSPLKDGRGLPNGAAYDPLDFSQAEEDPDEIRALVHSRSQLYVLGSESTQIFRNAGRSPAPFVGIQGASIQLGVYAIGSVQLVSGGIGLVGGTKNETAAVWLIVAGSKKKLSTQAIDNRLAELSDTELQSITSWYYADSGHYFYGINLPDTTFSYDLNTGRWHERQSVNGTDLTKYRAEFMVTAYGRIMVGDNQDGRIGFINRETYTDYGFLQRRFAITQAFDNTGDPVFLAGLELVCESGVGLTSDVTISSGTNKFGIPISVSGGEDPQVTLSWSDDGGYIFEGEISRSLGKIGEHKARQIWRRLGRFPRSRILKFEVSTPNKVTLIKAEADISG